MTRIDTLPSRQWLPVLLALFSLIPTVACGGGGDAEEPDGQEETAGGEDLDFDDEDSGEDSDEDEDSDEEEIAEGDEDEDEDSDEGEEETTEDVNPRVAWRQMVGRGRSVFRQACDTCHPNGEDDLGPTLRRIRWTTNAMDRQIRRGSGRMRPIPESQLPERYMSDLMAYLSTIGAVVGVDRPR